MEDRKANAVFKFQKNLIASRYWLLNAANQNSEYLKPYRALEESALRNTGFRKDGFTPKFSHQLSVFQYIRTISTSLIDVAGTLATGLLHDDIEDHSVTQEDLERDCDGHIAHSVYLTSKKSKMNRFPDKDYPTMFRDMAEDPRASIVKPADRSHNFSTMLGVFNREKQLLYIDEGETFYLPMIKIARRKFPQQEMAYENLKHFLKCQIEMIKAMHEAAQ